MTAPLELRRIARQEIGDGSQVAAQRGVGGPRSARAVEDKAAALIDLVEDVQARAPVLAAELSAGGARATRSGCR